MKQLLGFTRYVVLLGVAGNLIAAAILFLFLSGLPQAAKIGAQVPRVPG
jgi:hypothetical protein